jgi:subtilisin family serine protease
MAQIGRVRPTIKFVVWCASLYLLVAVALAQAADSRIIAVFKEDWPPEDQLAGVAGVVAAIPGATILHVLSLSDSIAVLIPTLSLNLAKTLLGTVPGVEEVIDDKLTVVEGTTCVDSAPPPLKEAYGWGLKKSSFEQVPSEWKGAGMMVAVVDTGIYQDHADLKGKVGKKYNVTGGPNYDDNGHGTHIAGIIAADLNNLALIGGASEVTLASVKVLNSKGIGYLSDVCRALEWVGENGIQVVNMSFGFPDNTTLLRTTQALYNLGVIQVAAAGNRCAKTPKSDDGGGDECHRGGAADCDDPQTKVKFPAGYAWVLAVGATNINNGIAPYSCEGPEIDFVASGGDLQAPILSTNKDGRYGGASGTSQAAAHATAAVALALQKQSTLTQKTLTLEQLRSVLQATATTLADSNNKTYDKWLQGAGLIHAGKMIEALPWKQK